MSLAEAAKPYNLTLKFEAVHYISGDNDTEENAYSIGRRQIFTLAM